MQSIVLLFYLPWQDTNLVVLSLSHLATLALLQPPLLNLIRRSKWDLVDRLDMIPEEIQV